MRALSYNDLALLVFNKRCGYNPNLQLRFNTEIWFKDETRHVWNIKIDKEQLRFTISHSADSRYYLCKGSLYDIL